MAWLRCRLTKDAFINKQVFCGEAAEDDLLNRRELPASLADARNCHLCGERDRIAVDAGTDAWKRD